MLDVQRLALRRYRLLHGYHVHADARAAGRHQLRHAHQRQIGHALEEIGNPRVVVRKVRVHHHDLRAAGDEHVQHPALLMLRVLAVQVLPVVLNQADGRGHGEYLLQFLRALSRFLHELLRGHRLALVHAEQHVQHVVPALAAGVDAGAHAPEFRRGLRQLLLAEQHRLAVGYLLAQPGDLLFPCHLGASLLSILLDRTSVAVIKSPCH